MANEADDIVQNIVLAGNEDVERAFNSIQEAGTKAFESIEKAIESSVFSFKGLTTVVAGVAASIAIVGVGMFEFVKSTEEGVSAMSDLADQTGTTTEEISGLTAAFAAGGISANDLQFAFRRLSVAIQQSWTEIKKASAESADKLKGDALSVAKAQDTLTDSLQKQATLSRDQNLQRISNIQSVASAQLKLDELNSKFAQSQGIDTTQFDAITAAQKDALAIDQARLAVAEARKKQQDDALKASQEADRISREIQQNEIAVRAAQRTADEDRKNDINNIIDAVKKVAAGDADALKSINANADNIFKGIVGATGDAGKALGELRGDLSDLSSPAPGVKSVFLELGAVMKNLEDPALKTAIAYRTLGRTVSQEFLNVLSKPDKLEEFIQRTKAMGLAVTDVDKEISENFRTTLFTLENDLTLVANKIASAFGPGFTTILKAVDDALIHSKQGIIDFAETIANNAVPVVESFIRVLSGAPDVAKDQWLIDYTDKIKAFASGVASLVGLFATVFTAIFTAADKAATGINDVFGTSLNGIDVIFALWVGRIIRGFIAVQTAAATAATGVEVAFATTAATFGIIGAAIFAVIKAYDAFVDIAGIGKTSHWNVILEGTLARLAAIGEILTGNISKGLADWAAANEKQAAAEKSLDDIDRQIAINQKARQAEIAKAEKDAQNAGLEEHKKTANEHKDIDTKTADAHIANTKRVVESDKSAAAANVNPNFPGLTSPGTGTQVQGGSASVIDVQKSIADLNARLALSKSGSVTQDQTQFGRPPFIEPPVPLPINRPEDADRKIAEFADAVTEFKESVQEDKRTQDAATQIPGGPGSVPLTQLNNLPLPDQVPLSPDLSPATGLTDLKNAITGIPDLFQSFKDGISSFIGTIQQNLQNLNTPPDSLNNTDESLQKTSTSADAAVSSLDALTTAADNAARALNASGTSNPVTAAGGGYIRGPGSGTSDSIPAWLSNEEYVHTARATRFWGVDFMHAINNLQMPKFSMGGLVGLLSPQMPRFAGGGLVSGGGGGSQHLGVVDLRTDHGAFQVFASSSTADALQRAAVTKRITRTGRKPGFIG